MIEALYVPGHSWLHRLAAGPKLLLLLVAGIGLFLTQHWLVLAPAAVIGVTLLALTGVSRQRVWRQMRGLLILVVVVGVAVGLFSGWIAAAIVVLRLVALIALALAVTFSTPTAALIEVCERAMEPLDRRGWVNAAQISLALSLALRFIPEIHARYIEIREAQAARGLKVNPVLLVVPLVIAVLKSADAIAEAIDARGFPPEPPR